MSSECSCRNKLCMKETPERPPWNVQALHDETEIFPNLLKWDKLMFFVQKYPKYVDHNRSDNQFVAIGILFQRADIKFYFLNKKSKLSPSVWPYGLPCVTTYSVMRSFWPLLSDKSCVISNFQIEAKFFSNIKSLAQLCGFLRPGYRMQTPLLTEP